MGVEKGTAGRKRKQEAVTFELPPVLPNDLQASGAFVPPTVGVESVPGVADAPAATPEPAPVTASDAPVPPPVSEIRGGDAEAPAVAVVSGGGGGAGDGPRGDEKKGGPRGRKVYKKVLYYSRGRALPERAKRQVQERVQESETESDSTDSSSSESGSESESEPERTAVGHRPREGGVPDRGAPKASERAQGDPVVRAPVKKPRVESDSEEEQWHPHPVGKYFYV